MRFSKIVVLNQGDLSEQMAFMSALHGFETEIWSEDEIEQERAKRNLEKWSDTIQADNDVTKSQMLFTQKNLHFSTKLEAALKKAQLIIETTDNEMSEEDFASLADVDSLVIDGTSKQSPENFTKVLGTPNDSLGYEFKPMVWKDVHGKVTRETTPKTDLVCELKTFAKFISSIPVVVEKEHPDYIDEP